MRVLLVQTPSIEGIFGERVYPIGIVVLAGILRLRGHHVEALDMNMEEDPFGAVKERLLYFRPEAVGLSFRNIDPLANKTSSLFPPFLVTARMVKSILPDCLLIAGGTGFSLFPQRIMSEVPEIDYGIAGEAEESLPALLDGRLKLIKGGFRLTPPSQRFDMARYKAPSRAILDPARYADVNSYVPSIGIEAKRGCPFRCAYCVYPKLQGRKLRVREVKSVVDEMEDLNKEYGIERFHFTDPVLNSPRGHLETICNELLRRKLNLKWSGFLREDSFDEKNAALFERAGCECFSFSPDGLCQESLDTLRKGMSVGDILKASRAAAATEVISVYHFLVNVPGETEATCVKGEHLLEKIYGHHERKRNLGTVVINGIRILPGTHIEALALENGVIGPGSDLLYPTYYNPKPFDTFRYRLEAMHLNRNVFMRHGLGDAK